MYSTYFTGSIHRTNPTVQYTSHNSDIAHAEGGRQGGSDSATRQETVDAKWGQIY